VYRFLLGCLLLFQTAWLCAAGSDLPWQRDDRAAFVQAEREQRFVLLYLEAVWCHWCHVMDHQTYADPTVRGLIDEHYVPLRIDQDSRPDLANRYRDYGWPATIVLAADGTEIVKRAGYIAPENFARLLQAIVDDPSPEQGNRREPRTAAAVSGELPSALRAELQSRHLQHHDSQVGGLDQGLKFVDRDSVEWSLTLAAGGDARQRARAAQTLQSGLALLDPVWGGFYQYSTHSDWQHPHFEKLTTLQGDYLRLYALGCAQLQEAAFCAAARSVCDYAARFLRDPAGGYRASQDADLRPGEHSAEYFALDDAGRLALGIPRVAPQVYARETGAMIEGLATLAEVSGDEVALAAAREAAQWAIRERLHDDGHYAHDADDAAGPYLGDSLRMSRAFLALYRASGERAWLQRAREAMRPIERFRLAQGYATAVKGDTPIAPLANVEENIALARHANLLMHYSGDAQLRSVAEHALAYLAQSAVALATLTEPGILQVDRELAIAPLHLTVVGARADAQAALLYRAALAQPGYYKRVEWWDRSDGPLANADVEYPKLRKAAAFVCTERQCSTPIFEPQGIAEFLAAAEAPRS
jgi:uncharacterized protein YyaL (SSP411 family)